LSLKTLCKSSLYKSKNKYDYLFESFYPSDSFRPMKQTSRNSVMTWKTISGALALTAIFSVSALAQSVNYDYSFAGSNGTSGSSSDSTTNPSGPTGQIAPASNPSVSSLSVPGGVDIWGTQDADSFYSFNWQQSGNNWGRGNQGWDPRHPNGPGCPPPPPCPPPTSVPEPSTYAFMLLAAVLLVAGSRISPRKLTL
jgi:hypothetical protein